MIKIKILIASVILSLGTHSLIAQVVINEYSAANFSTTMDNYGDTPDWIELYNAGGAAVNLSNYFLSDKITNPLKWQ